MADSTAACVDLEAPEKCQFYLERKRRHCKCPPAPGGKYCVEHAHIAGAVNDRKRIACPLDPKHTCYEHKLETHLKKCNAREKPKPVYYKQNINSGVIDQDDETEEMVTMESASSEQVLYLVEKVKALYQECKLSIPEEILMHDILQEDANDPNNGAAALKHINQQSSILGHMKNQKLLDNNTCYIEFGAGRGHLSHWVQKALSDCDNTSFLLIDRGTCRYKMDSYHKGNDQGPSFERLRIDIEHLSIKDIPSIKEHPRPIIAMSKHLCGAATDLTLRCLLENYSMLEDACTDHVDKKPKVEDTLSKPDSNSKVKGIAIALCCHHRCSWKSYVGKEFFSGNSWSQQDFQLLLRMTSWATCGSREDNNQTEGDDGHDQQSEEPAIKKKYGDLTVPEREEIGRQCKRLLDIGRMKYLEKHGLISHLKAYVPLDTSLENIILIATPKEKANDSS